MSASVTPRVSILVPGYRTTFLRPCLDSAVEQSWSDLEILVGDDCPTDAVRSVVEDYAKRDSRVRRVRFPGRGGRANMLALFAEARGEFVKYLNDDDLLHPRCVERMLRCLEAFPGVALVASHRRRIDAAGNELPETLATRRPVPVDSVIEGRSLVEELLARRINFVGEPTSVMFRRRDLAGSRPDILSFAGRRAAANGDVSMWVTLLSRGDAIYLVESLSSFRQHDGQRQREPGSAERGLRGWEQLCADARAAGLLPELSPAGLRSRPLEARPWWPPAAHELCDELERLLGEQAGRAALPVVAELEALLPAEPALAAAHGAVLLECGETTAARERLAAAVRAAPWDVDCRRWLALACMAGDDVEEALRQLFAVVAAAPDDPVAGAALARLAETCAAGPETPALTGALDGPRDGAAARGTLSLDGWVLAHPAVMDAPLQIEVTVDGTTLRPRPPRFPRDDVLADHPELAPFNPAPGFTIPLLLHGLSPGEHRIACTARRGASSVELGQARIRVLDDADGEEPAR